MQSKSENDFQESVFEWTFECFGEEIAANTVERNHRFLEESLELVQACGCTRKEAHELVGYVFGRQVGQREQELGGALTTLAALANAHHLNMMLLGYAELDRCFKNIEKIRAKQAAKPKFGPLAEASPAVYVACIERDGITLYLDAKLPIDNGWLEYGPYNLTLKTMSRKDFDALPEFEGF